MDTVQKLIDKFNETGNLQSSLEIYDTSGRKFEIVEVYSEDEGVVCIDIQRIVGS